jgi:hypothetical protein
MEPGVLPFNELFAREGAWPRLASIHLCVPKTSSTSCDQVIFVDQATDARLSSDAVLTEIDRLGIAAATLLAA